MLGNRIIINKSNPNPNPKTAAVMTNTYEGFDNVKPEPERAMQMQGLTTSNPKPDRSMQMEGLSKSHPNPNTQCR